MARLPRVANTEGNTDSLDDNSPVPAGEYPAMIHDSDYIETKAKNGHYLKLSLKIIEGEYKGKFLWDILNLDNPNKDAVEIANKTINSISQACAVVGAEDSEELHNIPMIVTVIVKEATAMHPASNGIKNYKSYDGGGVVGSSSTRNTTVPWEKEEEPKEIEKETEPKEVDYPPKEYKQAEKEADKPTMKGSQGGLSWSGVGLADLMDSEKDEAHPEFPWDM